VFILKEVKVVCFDTLLQVLILKNLYCTRIVQEKLENTALGLAVQGSRKQKRQQGCWRCRTQGAMLYITYCTRGVTIVKGKTEDFLGDGDDIQHFV
jgi:hypothetical protein